MGLRFRVASALKSIAASSFLSYYSLRPCRVRSGNRIDDSKPALFNERRHFLVGGEVSPRAARSSIRFLTHQPAITIRCGSFRYSRLTRRTTSQEGRTMRKFSVFLAGMIIVLAATVGVAQSPDLNHIYATTPIKVVSRGLTPSGAGGYSPAQFKSAYGFNRIPNLGAGQTIALVDAYDDPNIASDLAFY